MNDILNSALLVIILAFLTALIVLAVYDKMRGIKTVVPSVKGAKASLRNTASIFLKILFFPFRLVGKILAVFAGGIVMAGGLSVLALVYLFPIILLAALIAFFLKVF